MAATPCYRREAGSAGRDTRGLLRSHEFDKIEILCVATPEQAPALLEEMVGRAESTIAALGLPYRTIEICAGDLGQSHHRSFDVEVFAPGVDTWLEVSSVSWFSDYQARRANIRFRRSPVDGQRRQGAQGDRDRPHAERLGARRAAGAGGDHRELPAGRRLDRHPRRRCTPTPAATRSIPATMTEPSRRARGPPRAVRPAGAVRDGGPRRRRRGGRPDRAVAALVRGRQLGRRARAERDGAGDRDAPTASPTPATSSSAASTSAASCSTPTTTAPRAASSAPTRVAPASSRGSTCTARSACAAR